MYFFFLMIRRPPRSTLFPLHDALPIYPAHRLLAHRPTQHLLRRDKEQVPAVERQDRQQVEECQVQADKGQQLREESLLDRRSAHRGYPYGPRNVPVEVALPGQKLPDEGHEHPSHPHYLLRSEERRVGKECRSRWS